MSEEEISESFSDDFHSDSNGVAGDSVAYHPPSDFFDEEDVSQGLVPGPRNHYVDDEILDESIADDVVELSGPEEQIEEANDPIEDGVSWVEASALHRATTPDEGGEARTLPATDQHRTPPADHDDPLAHLRAQDPLAHLRNQDPLAHLRNDPPVATKPPAPAAPAPRAAPAPPPPPQEGLIPPVPHSKGDPNVVKETTTRALVVTPPLDGGAAGAAKPALLTAPEEAALEREAELSALDAERQRALFEKDRILAEVEAERARYQQELAQLAAEAKTSAEEKDCFITELEERHASLLAAEAETRRELENELRASQIEMQQQLAAELENVRSKHENSEGKMREMQSSLAVAVGDHDPAELAKSRKQRELEWQQNFDTHCRDMEEVWLKKFDEKKAAAELVMQRSISEMRASLRRSHRFAQSSSPEFMYLITRRLTSRVRGEGRL